MHQPVASSTPSLTPLFLRRLLGVMIAIGILAKFYDLNAPWKTHDHYNYGGAATTAFAECLKSMPLATSRGVPTNRCWTDNPTPYASHPPTILFGLWGWTSIFGSQEAGYRSFFAFFSVLNILMMYLIGRRVERDSLFPWFNAFFQAAFLGNLYFATHPDFIGEVTVFFLLLTAWLALSGRRTLACCAGLLAGISSWPGYIVFAPLLIDSWNEKKGVKRTIIFGALGLAIAFATLMYLQNTWDIVEFLKWKLMHPSYVAKQNKGLLEPLHFVRNFITSQARLAGPLFCMFAFFALFRRQWRNFNFWKHQGTPFSRAVLLCGGTGFFYALIGHEYVMVHVFLYLLFTPALAILAADFLNRMLVGRTETFHKNDLIWLTVLGLLFASLYPYGIYKSNAVHDALTATALAVAVLVFFYLIWRQKLTARATLVLTLVTFAANISEMINYRNEPDTERSACEAARVEFMAKGRIENPLVHSMAKEFLYCRDLPVKYEGQ